MSHEGIEYIKKSEFIFEDVKPYVPEINLEELKIVQEKIENFTSGKSAQGLTTEEAEKFLDWVTFNARSYAVRNIPEPITTASMFGQCAPTQNINKKLLSKLGLEVRTFNTSNCIGEIPMNESDREKIERGFLSTAVRHSVSLVNIPIIDSKGQTNTYEFLLDPTFRQFCLKENCDVNKFTDKNWLEHGYVAPHPGFFMMKENLKWLGESDIIGEKSEKLCKTIISKGYFYLNEENAKLYGDAFVRASKRLEYQNYPIYMEGKDYIKNFENIPMQTMGRLDDAQFTKLPSEIEKPKGIIQKIADFFKDKFNRKPKMILSGSLEKTINIPNNVNKKPTLESAMLSDEQLQQFRIGEQKKLEEYKKHDSFEKIEPDEKYMGD